jgi:hypothetical protein
VQTFSESPCAKDPQVVASLPNCQFCECLRQLVFQAKDCIEDLKTEIDEWKELCA